MIAEKTFEELVTTCFNDERDEFISKIQYTFTDDFDRIQALEKRIEKIQTWVNRGNRFIEQYADDFEFNVLQDPGYDDEAVFMYFTRGYEAFHLDDTDDFLRIYKGTPLQSVIAGAGSAKLENHLKKWLIYYSGKIRRQQILLTHAQIGLIVFYLNKIRKNVDYDGEKNGVALLEKYNPTLSADQYRKTYAECTKFYINGVFTDCAIDQKIFDSLGENEKKGANVILTRRLGDLRDVESRLYEDIEKSEAFDDKQEKDRLKAAVVLLAGDLKTLIDAAANRRTVAKSNQKKQKNK